MPRRRGWDGRFVRSRHYVDEAVRVDASEARAAGVLPGHAQVRVVVGPVDVDVVLRWRDQPRAARGGGGGAVLTFACPLCLRSRRSLYLLRAVAPVVGCRACLGLAYRSTARDPSARLWLRAERLREQATRPRAWSSTRLRALDAWQAADAAYGRAVLTAGPRWWRRLLAA